MQPDTKESRYLLNDRVRELDNVVTDRSAPPESTERIIHAAVAAVYTHTHTHTSREKETAKGMCLEAARWVQTLELNENLKNIFISIFERKRKG